VVSSKRRQNLATCLKFGKKISCKVNREGVLEQFMDVEVKKSIEIDLEFIEHLDRLIWNQERHILRNAREHDPHALYLLRTVHGIGPVLSLSILYEIHDVSRFFRAL